jgi:hypothetical protein
MQSYFLLAGQTVYLRGPYSLNLYGTARALDLSTKSTRGNGDLYARPEFQFVIGTSLQNKNNGNLIDNILAYAYGDTKYGFNTTRIAINVNPEGN